MFLSVRRRRRRRRRGDRFFAGTLFQDRHRRPQAAGEPESIFCKYFDLKPVFHGIWWLLVRQIIKGAD